MEDCQEWHEKKWFISIKFTINILSSFFTITTRSHFTFSRTLLAPITIHSLDFKSVNQPVILWLEYLTENVSCLCLIISRFFILFYFIIKTCKRRVAKWYIHMIFTTVNLRENLYGFLIADRSESCLSILLIYPCDISETNENIRISLSKWH